MLELWQEICMCSRDTWVYQKIGVVIFVSGKGEQVELLATTKHHNHHHTNNRNPTKVKRRSTTNEKPPPEYVICLGSPQRQPAFYHALILYFIFLPCSCSEISRPERSDRLPRETMGAATSTKRDLPSSLEARCVDKRDEMKMRFSRFEIVRCE